MPSGFTMDTSRFKSGKHLDQKMERALYGVCKYWDGKVERHMRHNAPWTDRTTNARNGLAAQAAKLDRDTFAIILSHAVDYGIYLELGHSHSVERKDGSISEWTVKPYPIIIPSMNLYAPKVIAFCTKLLDRLDRRVG